MQVYAQKITPRDVKCSLGPIPDNIKILGEFIEPADNTTSLFALAILL